eukprot:CAMPEP_0197529294 /NCGR_PEP_ID=MMETSP1318-20131121/27934_1 /TAXON_ID=552666 /ORGANISM="Partenskyella glossopodia, Strain RCC365" /LENGTH=610 /DNA_ID=CAMNT_0043084715 /DNA_START=122 /DNA_END=1954 /DNA_ORIENTATION=-
MAVLVGVVVGGSSSDSGKWFNPYEALGVRKGASEREVKEAYRTLAKHFHPDKNKDAQASTRFLEIQKAHEILASSASRKEWEEKRRAAKHKRLANTRQRSRYARVGDRGSSLSPAPRETIRLSSETYSAFVRGRFDGKVLKQEPQFWLIYVHSIWCRPCELFKDTWEAVAKRGWPAFRPADILIDYDYSLAQNLGVRAVPAVIAVKVANGKENRHVWTFRKRQRVGFQDVLDFATRWMSDQNPIQLVSSKTPKFKQKLTNLVNSNAGGGRYTKGMWSGGERITVSIISGRGKPHLSLAYAAMIFPMVRFIHIYARESDVRNLAMDALSLDDKQRDKCEASTCMVVIREENWPREVLNKADGVSNHPTELVRLVESRSMWFIPQIDASNYYKLCYRYRGGYSSPKSVSRSPRTGLISDESASFDKEKFCVLALSGSSKAARRALQPLSSLSQPPSMGWIHKTSQKKFVAFFSDKFDTNTGKQNKKTKKSSSASVPAIRAVVAVRPPTGEYAVFQGSESKALASWVHGLQNGSVSFVTTDLSGFDDEEEDGGSSSPIPFPVHGKSKGGIFSLNNILAESGLFSTKQQALPIVTTILLGFMGFALASLGYLMI